MLFPVLAFSQVGDTLTKSKFELSIWGSPDYSFRTLKANSESKWVADIRDSLEMPKLGYTIGAGVGYLINKKIKIEAGVFFSDKGQRTKQYALETTTTGQQPTMYAYNFHYYYLDIPVKVDYYLMTDKLKVYVMAGVSANVFLVQKTTSVESHANSDVRTNTFSHPDFNRLNVAVVAGLGINYPINKKSTLLIEPMYSRSVTSIINAPVKEYLYSVGVNIGVQLGM